MTAGQSLPLVVTPGEPGGIGSEIAFSAWHHLHTSPDKAFALLSDVDHLKGVAQKIGFAGAIEVINQFEDACLVFGRALPVLHRPLPQPATLGTFSAGTAPWVIAAIREAVGLCMAGKAAAMVTNPIQKEALYAAGFSFQGHTDFLASLAQEHGGPADDVMMLVGGGLRAIPVTVHIALKDVATQLTKAAIVTQGAVVHDALKRFFRIAAPRIAVTGLNPHAGENGSMGLEDIEIIRPAIAELKAKGINAFGPLPADTAFFPQARDSYDAILCMYHDQALIPVKTLDFHGGVNVTLGLPFIRTSPDHGTALNLAGTGQAQAHSLIEAITLAAHMAQA